MDVDNTLLDDDRVLSDLRRHLKQEIGRHGEQRYQRILERLHPILGYADYLGALQRYRQRYPHDPHVLALSSFLINYPFADRLDPHALQVILHCRHLSTVVILSDSDVVFQPHKVERAGLAKAVADHVLIYTHKERELRHIRRCYPATHYVVIDDNLHVLQAIKRTWGTYVTTIYPKGNRHRRTTRAHRPPDVTIHRIGDVLKLDLDGIRNRTGSGARTQQHRTTPPGTQNTGARR